MKRDGHTHTQYCLHGSGEETEAFILRAIEEGFDTYSLTEHLPLPGSFIRHFPYDSEIVEALDIRGKDLDAYFREMLQLQKKYRNKIRLLVGMEIDYLPDHVDYTRSVLKEYGKFMEDGLLSVHILQGKNGWRAVDFEPADFQEGLIDYYGDYEKVQLAYYQAIQDALRTDYGPYAPKRIGHLTLINKFQHFFNQFDQQSTAVKHAVLQLLEQVKDKGFDLDYNVSGLYKTHCREEYPAPWVVQAALRLGIPLVYGSDSHAVADVGRAYHQYEALGLKPNK